MFSRSLFDTIKRIPKLERTTRRLLEFAPSNFRLSKEFWHWYAFFAESENWSREELESFQMDCLRDLLTNLERNSEYYREKLSDIDIQDLETIEQYRELIPTLSRTEIHENRNKILAQNWKSYNLSTSQTSGTTGLALQFYHLSSDDDREWAAICHQWKRVGYIPGKSRRAEFRGLTTPGRLIDYFPTRNMIRCSVLDLKPDHVRYYADQIKKAHCTFLHGYPSALYLLASQISNSGINFPQPEAILLASEVVYDWQLNMLRNVFPTAKLYAHYGCAERTVLAGWCEYRQDYHVLPQYSLVEIDHESKEIIGTNLFNSVNGFLRYKMTDTVLDYTYESCPDCKRNYLPRLLQLGGRIEDYLFSIKNGWIPPAIITYPLKSLRAIKEIQFVQKEKNQIKINFSLRPQRLAYLDGDIEKMQSGLRQLFGDETDLLFHQVTDFPRSTSGKFKWIICELDEEPHRKS